MSHIKIAFRWQIIYGVNSPQYLEEAMIKQNRRMRVFALLCIFALIFAFTGSIIIPASADSQGKLLYAGGIPFGVKFYSKGVVVAGFCYVK